MRAIYTLIFISCIGFSGVAIHAQPPRGNSLDDLFNSMVGNGLSGASSGNTVDDAMRQMTGISGAIGQQTSAIEAGLLVVDVPTLEVNQPVVETIDTKTKRYPPRLKINFAEFPLRTLASPGGRNADSKTQANIIAQRVQHRLQTPHIGLVVQDRIAVLSGTVATEKQRSLAESMLRFEPGIDAVQNQITITPQ